MDPAGTGKNTVAQIFAKHYLGENWKTQFTEINASDECGIDDIREKIKRLSNLIMTLVLNLTEADGLTPDSQHALRRIMETSRNAVFILDANDESKIIDPIKSRCTEFRFKPLSFEDVNSRLYEICESEGVTVTHSQEEKEAFAQIYKTSKGDMRKAINELEKAITADNKIEAKIILEIEEENSDEGFSKTDDASSTSTPDMDKSKQLEGWKIERTELGETYSKAVEIKSHLTTAKGKVRKYGRIQLSVDESLIGKTAEIKIVLGKKTAK